MRTTIQIASMCTISEIMSSMCIIISLITEYIFNTNNIFGYPSLSMGMSTKQIFDSIYVMIITLAVQIFSIIVSSYIIQKRKSAMFDKKIRKG